MVTLDYIRAAVLRCRSDTAFRSAFARALGMPVRASEPERIAAPRTSVYAGLDECFANRESVMDGRVV